MPVMRSFSLSAMVSAVAVTAESVPLADTRPNFVYVLCDDMNELLGDEAIVKQTTALLADKGARALYAFVSSPKCTPSRSAWLSGRYYHNLRPHGATSGRGLNTTHFFDIDAVFPTLKRNGYQTALFGKIHNNQASWLCKKNNHTEPFTHIETECSPCGNYNPTSFVTKMKDGPYTAMEELEKDDPRTHYSHAQYGNRSVAWIKNNAANGPFFVFVGTTGPHLPATPAPWHQAIANELNLSAPRTPNFNMLAGDHFDLLSTHAILDDKVVADIDNLMRQRWGVLMSIDDLVAGLVQAVEDAQMTERTYFLFSSDHGYHLGQFRIPIEKMLPYETDIRIPLFIKGPGIAAGTKLNQMVANIDIAPTLLDLAGIPVPPIMDGQSMVPLLMGTANESTMWRSRFASEFAEGGKEWKKGVKQGDEKVAVSDTEIVLVLASVQTYGPFPIYDNPDNQWRMLRVMNDTHNLAYIEWDKEYVFDKIDFQEYYDLNTDPWQKKNLYNSSSEALKTALHAELVDMFTCTGTRTEVSNCHVRSSSPLPPPAPTPAPPLPTPPPPGQPTPAPAAKCARFMNDTDILGNDMVSPCQIVAFPGNYTGAVQCQEMCDKNEKCVAWTFHKKDSWRCCVKDKLSACRRVHGMWSGLKKPTHAAEAN